MNTSLQRSLKQQHVAARNILAYRRSERNKDAIALAELIMSVYKEKKRTENVKIVMDQNNAIQSSN